MEAVAEILNSADKFSTELRAAMVAMTVGEEAKVLTLELALIADAGKTIYDFVYLYEGDGFLAHKMYTAKEKVLAQLSAVINAPHLQCARVTAAVQNLATSQAEAEAMLATTCAKAAPVLEKFRSYFEPGRLGRLRDTFNFYMAFSILCPHYFRTAIHVSPAAQQCVDHILTFPALREVPGLRTLLSGELATYYALAENAAADVDALRWWVDHRQQLPNWYRWVVPVAAIFQPTSCAAERVFAMVRWMFDDSQQAALEDMKSGSLVLRYNRNRRMAEGKAV
jgi:hypothetical protein